MSAPPLPDLSKYNPKNSFYLTSTAIIIKNNRILIVKRSPNEKAFPNKRDMTGGKLEIEEYINRPTDGVNQWYNILEDSLRREVVEETGLTMKTLNYLCSLVFIRPDNIHVVVLSMYADYESGEMELNSEHTE